MKDADREDAGQDADAQPAAGVSAEGERPKQKMGPHLEWVKRVLAGDREVPRKQRHTAKRIWDRLKAERGFTGGYTIVKEAVRELTRCGQEVFVPLRQEAGTAQVDFGEALARIGGVLRKVKFFVCALPHSDAVFVKAYERKGSREEREEDDMKQSY